MKNILLLFTCMFALQSLHAQKTVHTSKPLSYYLNLIQSDARAIAKQTAPAPPPKPTTVRKPVKTSHASDLDKVYSTRNATNASTWTSAQLIDFYNDLGNLAVYGDPDDGGEVSAKEADKVKLKTSIAELQAMIETSNMQNAEKKMQEIRQLLRTVSPSHFGYLDQVRKKVTLRVL